MPERLDDLPDVSDDLLVGEGQVRQNTVMRKFLQKKVLCHDGLLVKVLLLHLQAVLLVVLGVLLHLAFVDHIHDGEMDPMGEAELVDDAQLLACRNHGSCAIAGQAHQAHGGQAEGVQLFLKKL